MVMGSFLFHWDNSDQVQPWPSQDHPIPALVKLWLIFVTFVSVLNLHRLTFVTEQDAEPFLYKPKYISIPLRGVRYIDEILSKADKTVFLKLSATYRYRVMEILKLSKTYRYRKMHQIWSDKYMKSQSIRNLISANFNPKMQEKILLFALIPWRVVLIQYWNSCADSVSSTVDVVFPSQKCVTTLRDPAPHSIVFCDSS